MAFLPSYRYVCVIVWMDHPDSNEKHGEKARRLHKNAKGCFEHILEAAPH